MALIVSSDNYYMNLDVAIIKSQLKYDQNLTKKAINQLVNPKCLLLQIFAYNTVLCKLIYFECYI